MAIAILALIGGFVAAYLWLSKIGALGPLRCGVGDCETVNTSRWATLFGQPLAFWGSASTS